ncbi:MAG TPA: HAD-IIIC family phosphatase [Dongiaceae bacterium]|nr:HAD-IIIC family phosphatase [Dongiaceae bacterium]
MQSLLPWLPDHPAFADAVKLAKEQPVGRDRLAAVIHLAGCRRDFVATEKLDRLAGSSIEPAAVSAANLSSASLAILSSHTVDHLGPAIRVAGLCRRLALATYFTPYGLYRQALLDADPKLAAFKPQFILLALDAYELNPNVPLDAGDAEAAAAIEASVTDLRRLWQVVRERFSAQPIQQTLVPTAVPLFGSFEGLVPGSPVALTDRLNSGIRAAAREDGVLLLDLAWHASRVEDRSAIGDPVRWHQAKQLISPGFAPLFGDWVARIVGAALGQSRKAVVVDLDNTLWGGVVGDDGLEGIQLGQGSAAGEAFAAFQRFLLSMSKRGIVLAVSSKNDSAIAESAFASHPEMVLRRSDIASFHANWDDKATNLRRIAEELNLGMEALVFVDDNPAERHMVRRELPAVAVPELPDDVAFYPARLADSGCFEATSYTAEDASRSRSYSENIQRKTILQQATDMKGYLKGLSMTLAASNIGPVDLPRATQLINKTNQFNLTTRRYTETEVKRLAESPEAVALSFRLRDRFGDNGLISVILARADKSLSEDALLIDTWLMSCRVLGRQVEAAAFEVLIGEVSRRGIRTLVGEYRPTARNGLVVDHYSKLGFVPLRGDGEPGEATFWRFDLEHGVPPAHFIKVERS